MAAETDPDALLEKLQTLNESLDELEEKLESLFETDLAEHLSDVSPLEAAKLNATVAYALATVIYGTAYLVRNGKHGAYESHQRTLRHTA